MTKKITNIPKIEDLGDGISIMNLNMQPFQEGWQSRTVSEYKQSKEFVLWGANNTYPDFLLTSSIKSSLLKGILNKEKTRVFAQGLELEDGSDILNHPFYKVNKTMTINELTKKLICDFSNISCFSFQNEYSLNGSKITSLYYNQSKDIRTSYLNEDDEIINYFIARNWNEYRNRNFTYNTIQNFYTKNTKNTEPSLIYSKIDNPIDLYYPEVSWESCLDYVLIDNEIAKFHLANIINGLNPGLIINFNEGTPTPEKKRELKEKIKNELQGANSAGKMILLFSDSKESEPTIKQLEVNNADKQFELLNDTVDNKILVATEIPRILSGLETTVGLSNIATSLYFAEKQWFNNTIKYKQDTILKSLNDIMIFNGMPLVKFRQNKGNMFEVGLSDTMLTTLFTVDEMRSELGYSIKNNTNINE